MTTERKPGEWPIPSPLQLEDLEPEPQHERPGRERARFHITLGAIRAALEEQPSERCVRDAARRWTEAITAVADEAVAKLRRPG